MQTFSDTEQEKLREAFEALVMNVGPAPELDDLIGRSGHARVAAQPRRRGLVVAAALAVSLVALGLTALFTSDGGDSVTGALDRGDVMVFFESGTPLGTLMDISDEVMTWEGVIAASPWTSQEAAREFAEAFADQPDLVKVIQDDPNIMPASVRIWVEPGTDLSAVGQRVREEFEDALEVSVRGEQRLPDGIDPLTIPESTLPPLEILLTQVDPIHGYGDYSAYSYANVPWDLVTSAQIACMRDQGWPVEPIGDTGISFAAVPFDQNQAAQIDFARCTAGLNLPEYEGPGAG